MGSERFLPARCCIQLPYLLCVLHTHAVTALSGTMLKPFILLSHQHRHCKATAVWCVAYFAFRERTWGLQAVSFPTN